MGTPSIKGFATNQGEARYDFNYLDNIPEALKSTPTAKVGQYLRVDAVDEEGKILSVSAVDVEAGSGESGGYYSLQVTQPTPDTMKIEFIPSDESMDSIEPQLITLPVGKDGSSGKDGNGIKSIVLNDDYTLTFTFDDDTSYTTTSIRGEQGEKGEKGDTGAKGDKGDTGATGPQGDKGDKGDAFTYSDFTPEQLASLKGEKGDKGEVGMDGVSPSITATKSGKVTTLTIVDADGPKTITINDGEDGAPGLDGNTPIKGKDYWTPEDKAEMVEQLSSDSSWLDGYNIPKLYLTGDTTGMSKDNAVPLSWAYGESSGSCTLKWQGSSSLAYDKKNYTIKLDTAIEVVDGWGSQKKYCLKANFIDHTHARNIVSARLWGLIVASRTPKNATLAKCPNYGAVDGFPVAIVLNGQFHGLYTWNIPKDGWMFGMGSGSQEAVICADDANYPAVDFRVHSKVNGDDHELEYVTDEDNTSWVATSLNRVIDMLVNSYGADLDTTIAQYLDWESAIDYFILVVVIDGRDMTGKNYIVATWDGTKWVFSAYDMDSTYGLDWNGASLLPPHEGVTFKSFRRNRVMELVYRFKTNALKERYKKLRETVLSEYAIGLAFENFGCGIPSRLLDEDTKMWASIPSTSVNTTDQILRWLHHRLAIVDKWVEELPTQETPVAPANRISNAVPTSIDKTGEVYNVNGYRDDYTINSNDVEEPLDGGCITGFIPVTKDTIIKVTTDHWNISPTNSRILFYNANFEQMAYYTQHGFVGLFNGYTNATAILAKDKQSVTYNTDGTTTLNIAYGAGCTDLAYIRIRGVGKGSTLAVIRDGEIPDTPTIPDNEPTNLVPTSIGTDGSVFNGTGYKDGYRLNSSGVEKEYATTQSTVTGFIKAKSGDVIRMKNITHNYTFEASGSVTSDAGYICFYDADFNLVDTFNGGGFSAKDVLVDEANSSWNKDANDVTTINIAWKGGNPGFTYFRISGYGSGANAIVTVNEEIA